MSITPGLSIISATALMCFASLACAGELRVDVFSRSNVRGVPRVEIDAADLTKATAENRWHFDLKSRSVVMIPIEVTIAQIPAGYHAVELSYALPYFADRTDIYPLGTAVVNDRVTDQEGVRPFLDEMGRPNAPFPNLFVLHQRARLLWQERRRQMDEDHRRPNADDVGIAYWVLLSAADLAKLYYYHPDQTVRDAANWINGQPDDGRMFQRVARSKVDSLIERLGNADTTLYEAVINRLQEDRNRGNPKQSCARFDVLDTKFSEMTEGERNDIDASGALRVKIKESVTWCAAQIVLRSTGPLPDDLKAQLQATTAAAREALGALSEASSSGMNIKHVRDNIKLIESYTGAASQ
ncbi:hypothetical protein C8J31_12010 [Rhizobium sp. PP-CC-2G-626]|nr:hypothetical protein C8J31_12010 [Rhizobium sp. PP-CC-2G-626]